MNGNLELCINRATQEEIEKHLALCEASFVPPLSARVEIAAYALKIYLNGLRFEAWADGALVGLVAIYCNDPARRVAFITSVSVAEKMRGNRIASHLIENCLEHLRVSEFRRVVLNVDLANERVIQMYESYGFKASGTIGRTVSMGLTLMEGSDK